MNTSKERKKERKMFKYFGCPTQIKFWDCDTERYIAGIAFEDKIICLECGGVIELDDFYEDFFPPEILPIIPLPWVSLNEECITM